MSLTRPALAAMRLLLVCTVLLGVAYPGLTWLVGRTAFADQVAGSVIEHNGQVVGSSLLGQQFTDPGHFHSRPSASDYAGGISGGSNLPASSAEQQSALASRSASLRDQDAVIPQASAPHPIAPDALTASASGLDPHISPAYAAAQVPRVAAATGVSVQELIALVDQATTDRTLGFLGAPRVNVVLLNESLEAARR